MISLNRGEWSELYGILFLIVRPNLDLVDHNLKQISNADIFELKKIILESDIDLEYQIVENDVFIYIKHEQANKLSISDIDIYREILLDKILNHTSKKGSFSIPSLDEFLSKFSNGYLIKAKSRNKADIQLEILDKRKNIEKVLSYSIKSSLGSPATILNASNHTNFLYEIENLEFDSLEKINSIKTRTKLLDRIKMINELGGKIRFVEVVSKSLDYNLKMIDSNLSEYIGNALLYSYTMNNKDLQETFIKSNTFIDKELGLKKLGDFLRGISFGFVPSTKWDGVNSVNGGLIIVKSSGKVVVLDLIYYSTFVSKYLVEQTKFDSPSSSRYNMLELYKLNSKIYFTLNLQIRYKK